MTRVIDSSGQIKVTGDPFVTTRVGEVSAASTVVIATPAPGKRILLLWVYVKPRAALGTGVVDFEVRSGATSVYKDELTGSQPFSHRTKRKGGVDEVLRLITTSAAPVIYNFDYKEIS